MNNLYTTLSIIFSLLVMLSCRSVERLVNKGRYDEAIDLAISKIDSKKGLKTKHLHALEEGFARINSRDIKQIDYLKLESDESKWDKIYSIITRIEDRQRRLDLMMPIVSNDGYEASFEFWETAPLKMESARGASQYHFRLAEHLLDEYDAVKNKTLARAAFEEFETVRSYGVKIPNIDRLQKRAYSEGVTHVLIKWDNSAYLFIPEALHGSLNTEVQEDLNRFWIRFYDIYDEGVPYDALAQVAIQNVQISPDREEINRSKESRIIPVVKDEGVESTDTLKTERPAEEYETLIYIVETIRTKQIQIHGNFEMRDYISGKLIKSENFTVSDDFRSVSVDESLYEGEVGEGVKNVYVKRGESLEPFPTDYQMISEAIHKLNVRFRNFINNIRAV